ncbi:MAG: hypothetical protein QOC70_1511 [Verrucomicrobiota bacterium]
MRLSRTARIGGEGGLALLVIVLLLLGGIVWWLYSSRQDAEKNARIFAAEVATRVAINFDEKFLHVHLSPDAQKTFLRSSRDRLLDRLREFGVPAQPIEIQGNVIFTSYFFDPHGTFHAQLKYPTTTAQLELDISRGMTVWQVDSINLPYIPPPAAAATPAPVASPTPAPAAAPEQKPTKRRRNR